MSNFNRGDKVKVNSDDLKETLTEYNEYLSGNNQQSTEHVYFDEYRDSGDAAVRTIKPNKEPGETIFVNPEKDIARE